MHIYLIRLKWSVQFELPNKPIHSQYVLKRSSKFWTKVYIRWGAYLEVTKINWNTKCFLKEAHNTCASSIKHLSAFLGNTYIFIKNSVVRLMEVLLLETFMSKSAFFFLLFLVNQSKFH